MTPQNLQIRSWFGNLIIAAERQLTENELPAWLEEFKQERSVRDELRKADVDPSVETAIRRADLRLYRGYKEEPPRPTAELRKELKRFINGAEKFRERVGRISYEVELALRGEGMMVFAKEHRDELTSVEWDRDPVGELRQALDRLLHDADRADLEACAPGNRVKITTVATEIFVHTIHQIRPSITRIELTRLVESLLGAVPQEVETPEPDWHDLVGRALEYHGIR